MALKKSSCIVQSTDYMCSFFCEMKIPHLFYPLQQIFSYNIDIVTSTIINVIGMSLDICFIIKLRQKCKTTPLIFTFFYFSPLTFSFVNSIPLTFIFCQFKTPLQIYYCCRYTHQNDAVLHVFFFLKGFQSLTLRERERERESQFERERDWVHHPCSPCKPPRYSTLTESVMGVLCLVLP